MIGGRPAEAARLLVEGWSGRGVVEIGSRHTPADLEAAMGQALGRPVQSRAIPREAWLAVLEQMGLGPEQAENWCEMQDGFNSSWIDFGRSGTVRVAGATSPADFFSRIGG